MNIFSKKGNFGAAVLLLGIILVAANLRAPLTAVGPLTGLIKDSIGISGTVAGFLTTIPLLAFAIISPMAPKIAEKISIENTIAYSVFFLIIGLFVRSIPNLVTLILGTILVGCSIAMCNVLIPSLIKKEFNHKLGIITGIYSISMNLCGAIASGISFPIALKIGWNNSLRIWVVLAIVACIAWIPQLERYDRPSELEELPIEESIWRSVTAWQVTLFMGLQSLVFYVLVAWLPQLLVSKGFSATEAGYLLSMMQLFLLPFTFITPIIAGRVKTQSKMSLFTALIIFLGILGLFTTNNVLIITGIALIGVGGGCAFGLSMMFFSLKTKSAKDGAELSGMAQSIGYLLAAVGPTLFGFVHDQTHNWDTALIILLIAVIMLGISGFFAGEDKYI